VAQLETLTGNQVRENEELKRTKERMGANLAGLQRSIAMVNLRPAGKQSEPDKFTDRLPVDRKTGEVTVAHTVVSLTAEQIDETQTLGTLTLTPEQWQEVRLKSPQSPKRFDNVVPLTLPDHTFRVEGPYVIELSRDRMAVVHPGDSAATVEAVRDKLFNDLITPLRMNERGQFYLDGKVVPFPTLLSAFATPPDNAQLDAEGKLVVSVAKDGRVDSMPRWLSVKLPSGAKPTDDVFNFRLGQIAAAADQMGLRHALFPPEVKKSGR
jgi:hypothetical protein